MQRHIFQVWHALQAFARPGLKRKWKLKGFLSVWNRCVLIAVCSKALMQPRLDYGTRQKLLLQYNLRQPVTQKKAHANLYDTMLVWWHDTCCSRANLMLPDTTKCVVLANVLVLKPFKMGIELIKSPTKHFLV